MFPSHARPPIRALLLDLSGTLHVGSSPTPNAVHALGRLRDTGSHANNSRRIPFRFCSNTSKEGRAELEHRLTSMGFQLQHSVAGGRETWTSLGALSTRLRSMGLSRPYCLLEQSARDEVLRDLKRSDSSQDEYDSVVVGLAPSLFSYDHLNAAFRVLLSSSPPKPLIATHKAKYIRTASVGRSEDANPDTKRNETLSLGPGPFVAALELAAGVQAEVVGKPSRAFFEVVIGSFTEDELSLEGGKIAVVGDDVETDLGEGAIELGLWRVLVKTGKYRSGDEHRPGITPPDEVHETFADFVASLLNEPTSRM